MEMFSLSERTVRRHLQEGILQGTKVGGSWRFSDEDLRQYLDSKTMRKSIQKTALLELYDYFNGYGKPGDALVMKKIPQSYYDNLDAITDIVNQFEHPFYMNMSSSETNKVLVFRGCEEDAIILLESIKE